MKKSSFFQKQLFFSLLGTVIFVILGFAAAFLYLESQHEKKMRAERAERNEKQFTGPLLQFVKMLEILGDRMPPEQALKKIWSADAGPFKPRLFVLDESGKLLASTVPESEFRPQIIDPLRLPVPPDLVTFLDEESRPSPFPPSVARLNTKPIRYLLMDSPRDPVGSGRVRPSGRFRPLSGSTLPTMLLFVLVAAVLSALLSFAVLFYYLRKNSGVIEGVIAEIHGGNLKARLPVKKLDELGQLMTRFNEMADEIERLVTRIRDHEKVRVHILEELGHDLRTPLASLSTMLETLETQVARLSDGQKRDIASLSMKEVKYLTRLVDDLLFLARVDDPRYIKQGRVIKVLGLLSEQIEVLHASHGASSKIVSLENEIPESLEFFADEHLLKRMIKNAIDNAVTYAKGSVLVRSRFDQKENQVVLTIEDDGPGFPGEISENFGTKRASRSFDEQRSTKISLGLGSVIIRAIVMAHQGSVQAANALGEDGKIRGARLEIRLPVRN